MNRVTRRIAVTDSTGKLDGCVARRLASLGIPQWLVVRDPSRAPALPDGKIRLTTYADFHASFAASAGELARVTGDVERLTGHPPLSLSTRLAKRA